MDKKLLAVLVCPQCKGKLDYDKKTAELICQHDALAYPVRDGIPVMLISDARNIKSVAK